MSTEEHTINTGGAYIEGAIQTGGDFVGRDKIVHEIHYHSVELPVTDIPFLAPSLPPHHIFREAEVAELRRLLLSEEHQVAVTALRGMAGVGKTTLAIALCHDKQIIEAFPNGIFWTTLGPQANLLSTQAAWGAALGVDLAALPTVEGRAARLRSLLHNKRCLLVIDDVWNADNLPPLQVGGPKCAVLVTTRERKIAQKVGVSYDLDVLEPTQALALLTQWAGEIADEERGAAEELARRLGYLPLALALAGAQIQDGQTWPGLLAAFLNAQGADLTLLDLDDPQERDESLTLAFSQSVGRLGDVLQEQFALLGMFAAGREAPFEAESVAAVWQVALNEAKKGLDRLTRAALLNKVGDSYTLHLLLGDYACRRLDEATRLAAEARHRVHYLDVVRRSEHDWRTVEMVLPQIRAAWNRINKDDADNLYDWAYSTGAFFNKRGDWIDWIAWLEAARTALQAAGQRQRESWCEFTLGEVYRHLGKLEPAVEHFQRSLIIRREMGDRVGEAESLYGLGYIYEKHGELDKAMKYYQASLVIRQEIGERVGEAYSLIGMGYLYYAYGKLEQSLECYQASLVIRRDIGDRGGEAFTLTRIGHIYRERDEFDQALAHYQASLTIYSELGDRAGEAHARYQIARILVYCGEWDEALVQLQASLAIWCELGNRAEEANLLSRLGLFYYYCHKKLDEALIHLQTSLNIHHEINNRAGEAFTLNLAGMVYSQSGQLDKALAQFQAALAIWHDVGSRNEEAGMLQAIGTTYEKMGYLARAEEALTMALALYEEMGRSTASRVRDDLERVRRELRQDKQSLKGWN